MFWNAGCPLLRAEDFSCSLDVLYGGLGKSKLQFLIKKILYFLFQLYIFFNFWPSNSGSGSIFRLKCWIRIRNQWIWIRNTAHSEQEYVKSTIYLLSLEWLHHPPYTVPSWQHNTSSTWAEGRKTERKGKGNCHSSCVSWREDRWGQFQRQQKVWSSLFLVPRENYLSCCAGVVLQDGAVVFLVFDHLLWRFVLPNNNMKKPVLRIRIRDPVPFWPLDPGSGIGFFGSRISDPKSIFLRA